MDDQHTRQSPAEPYELDAVTEELKAEFLRLKLETEAAESLAIKRARIALDALDNPNSKHTQAMICVYIDHAMLALDSIRNAYTIFGSSSFLDRQFKLWIGILALCFSALAKLKTLAAHSLLASLRVPLFLDGPELSGYKHRIR